MVISFDVEKFDLGIKYSSYFTCQGKWPKDEEAANEHIKNCLWCQNWIKFHEEIEKSVALSKGDIIKIKEKIRTLNNNKK